MRTAVKIVLAEGDRETLERWCRVGSTPWPLRERAQIVLLAAGG